MASTTLLLPQPLGPTIAVTPLSKASSERSGKLLNPEISSRFSRIVHDPVASADVDPEAAGCASAADVVASHRLSGYEDWPTTVWIRLPNTPHQTGWPLGPVNGAQPSN